MDFVCVHNHVRHAVICGHSDCRAMYAVYEHYKHPETVDFTSPIHSHLKIHGEMSREKLKKRYLQL